MNLTGSYSNDLNLVALDKSVTDYIINDTKVKSDKLSARLLELSKSPDTLSQYGLVYAEIQSISGILDEYRSNTKELIDTYKTLPLITNVKVFGSDVKTLTNQSEEDRKIRLPLISDYLLIASRYAPVSYQFIQKDVNMCSSCNAELKIGDTQCGSCDLILECEVLPQISNTGEVSNDNKLKAHLSNINRAVETLNLPTNPTYDISQLLTQYDLTTLPPRTPGKYIYFKLCQLKDKKVSRDTFGIGHLDKSTINKYDKIWIEFCKRNNLQYKPSF